MGQVKNQMMKQQEEEFLLELSYGEWLRDNTEEPSASEIMDMAKEMLSPSAFTEMFWYVYSANNVEYLPGRGV